jgi:lysophospholipase L1-like esterase
VDPASVRLRIQDGRQLEKGRDFVVDSAAGKIELQTVESQTEVTVDYSCWLTRLDTLVQDQKGDLQMLTGSPARSAPLPPELPEPVIPLANILSRWCNQPLDLKDVMAASGGSLPPKEEQERNEKVPAPLKLKLFEGKSVRLVFLGDSITAGFCAEPAVKSFPNLVISRLKNRFPGAEIAFEVYGFSGLKSRDVVQKLPEILLQSPDLLVVEFVNDLSSSVVELEPSYTRMVETCRKAGTCLMLVTPHFPVPSLAKSSGWKSIGDNPYISMLRDFSRRHDLADVSWRWQHLSADGLRPSTLLVNLLNHPNNKGHQIYAEEILRCLSLPRKSG